jgi:hypothetical protein
MYSTELTVGQTYARSAVTAEPGAFVHLDDGVPAHFASVVSSPGGHAIIATDQIGFRGPMPEWVGDAFESGAELLLFLEESPGAFVLLGSVMPCSFRTSRTGPSEMAFHVPDLPRAYVARFAAHLLDAVEPTPWSATAFIEATRTAGGWAARALGCDVTTVASTLLEALSDVEHALADRLLAGARDGAEIELEIPDTSGLRPLGASFDPDAASRSRRVLVQLGYYSADLALPGWAMSRDEAWIATEPDAQRK